jgi:hypothetical protein
MSKQVWGWIGLGVLIVLGLLAYNSFSDNDFTFAAIPASQTLGDVSTESGKTFTMTVSNTGDKDIANFWYRIELYGPNSDKVEAPASYSGSWINSGIAVAKGSSQSIPITIQSGLPVGPKWAILVYTGDSAATDDATKTYWTNFARSAYSEVYYSACIQNPVDYGCGSDKETCCHGSGYWFTVVSNTTPVCTTDSAKVCRNASQVYYTKCLNGQWAGEYNITCGVGTTCLEGVCKASICTANSPVTCLNLTYTTYTPCVNSAWTASVNTSCGIGKICSNNSCITNSTCTNGTYKSETCPTGYTPTTIADKWKCVNSVWIDNKPTSKCELSDPKPNYTPYVILAVILGGLVFYIGRKKRWF